MIISFQCFMWLRGLKFERSYNTIQYNSFNDIPLVGLLSDSI